jgi:hypothetical protein
MQTTQSGRENKGKAGFEDGWHQVSTLQQLVFPSSPPTLKTAPLSNFPTCVRAIKIKMLHKLQSEASNFL